MNPSIHAMPLVLAFVLAACGGGSAGGEVRPAQVAKDLGCTSSYQSQDTEETLFVRERGHCTVSGEKVQLFTFSDNETRDQWLSVASKFGGRYVVVDRAVVTSDSTSAVDTAHDKIGGDLR